MGSWEKALAKAQEGITALADRLSLLRKEQAEAREGITAAACAVHEKANRLRADLSVMPLELFGAAQQVSLMEDIKARAREGLTIPDDLMEDFRGGSAYAPLLAYNKAADAAAAAGERLEKERQRAAADPGTHRRHER